jgi:hypothetical protein
VVYAARVDVVTVPRVPVCRTGHFDLESGPVDFTLEHFAAAVSALASDPAVRPMRVRLELPDQGHLEPEAMAVEANGGQGGPSVGWADNYALEGNTLYADLHVPELVAGAMDWAFPGRSIEGVFGWQTATGQTHDFVATGLLLLGTSWPGVTTLPDFAEVQAEFAAEVAAGNLGTGTFVAPDSAVVPMLEAATVAARVEPTGRPPRPSRDQLAAASLNVNDLRLRWYGAESAGELEGLPESYDYWSWYVLEVRAEEDGTLFVLCIDENDGRMWRFDVASIDGPNVTFDEPTEVVLEVVPVTARRAARGDNGPSAWRPRPALARWTTRAESRAGAPAHPSAAAAAADNPQTTEADAPMNDALRRALASRHGLDPETATEAEIEAAELAAAEAAPEGGGDNPEPDTPEADTPEAERQPAGATARTVTVSRDTWEATQRAAEQGATARAEQIAAQRTAAVEAAIADGRITPAEAGLERNDAGEWVDGWRRDLDSAPEVVGAQLDRLERGRYPGATGRQGVAPQGEARTGDPAGLARARAGLGLRSQNTTPEGVK